MLLDYLCGIVTGCDKTFDRELPVLKALLVQRVKALNTACAYQY